MKVFTTVILLLFLCCLASLGICQSKLVSFRIVQDDSVFSSGSGPMNIHLRKKSFKIQVLLQHVQGFYSFASLKDSLEMLPDDQPVPGFETLPDMLVVEEENNKEKELTVEDHGWCYWACGPSVRSSGFNKKFVELDSGRVVGIKSVKQLYFPASRHTLKLKDVSMPIYIFFVVVGESDSKGRPAKELLRQKVRIDWVDND